MAEHFWLIDKFFLGPNESNIPDVSSTAASNILDGKIEDILNSNAFTCINVYITENQGTGQKWIRVMQSAVQHSVNEDCSPDTLLEYLNLGIALLQYFVQLNWTGPQLKEDKVLWCGLPSLKELNAEISLDTESVCSNVQGAQWLLLARAILIISQSVFQKSKDIGVPAAWWGLRCISIHQAVLEESSVQLHTELDSLQYQISEAAAWLAKEQHLQTEDCEENKSSTNIVEEFPELQDSMLRQARALFWVEQAQNRLQYSEVLKSRQCLQQALAAIGLQVSLVGALGKRTRFQARDLAQLTLKVSTMSTSDHNDSHVNTKDLPRDIKLNDEVRLPQVAFTTEQDGEFPSLTPVEHAVLLACYGQVLKSQPKDGLAEEELLPYLSCILNQPQIWSIQLTALLARCKLEASHRRTIERSMTQAQLLVDSITSETPEASQRLRLIYASQMPPRWKVEAELASLLISLGAINSALDIFLRLQLWEDVIACYHLLELRHKAAEVVKQELEIRPSPKLWCLLGNATDDVSCYETAWQLSDQRSALAKRHWGFYYFNRREYEQCVPHLEQSLLLNALQPFTLSRLAYCYLHLEDWQKCASKYRQLCSLDSENFEAWNNLAKSYVKLGEKARAWKVLQESIKCNYENWQVWDNLMVVSIDCAEYQEAIRAYHRLLDLRGSHVDTQVLAILVQAVNDNLLENRGQNAGRLRKRTLELFGRLTSIVTNDARVWQLYAQLAGGEPLSQQSLEKVVQLLQRAQRSATQAPNWYREVESCKEAAEIAISLADTCLDLSEQCTTPSDGVKLIASPRLAINSMLTKIKAQHLDAVSGLVVAELAECVQQLSAKLEELLQKNKSLTAS